MSVIWHLGVCGMATTLDDRCFLDPLKTIINPNPHPGAGGGPLPRTHIWSHEHHTVETEAAIPGHGPVSRLRVRDKVRVRAALARSLAVLAMPGLFRAMQPCNHAAVQPCGRATMRPMGHPSRMRGSSSCTLDYVHCAPVFSSTMHPRNIEPSGQP